MGVYLVMDVKNRSNVHRFCVREQNWPSKSGRGAAIKDVEPPPHAPTHLTLQHVYPPARQLSVKTQAERHTCGEAEEVRSRVGLVSFLAEIAEQDEGLYESEICAFEQGLIFSERQCVMVEIIVELSMGVVETPRSEGQYCVKEHLPRPSLGPWDDLVELGSESRLVNKGVRPMIHCKVAINQPLDDLP